MQVYGGSIKQTQERHIRYRESIVRLSKLDSGKVRKTELAKIYAQYKGRCGRKKYIEKLHKLPFYCTLGIE